MACNHSFRAIIGLSCKYLIRGLGEWGRREAQHPLASWLLRCLKAWRRHRGPMRQWLEEEGGSASGALVLWPPGWGCGPHVFARREFASYQA